MSKVLLLICMLLIASIGLAQNERNTIWLNQAEWEIDLSNGNSVKYNFISDNNLPDLIKEGSTISTTITCEQDASEGGLYFPGAGAFFDFMLNDSPLSNELNGENFHAETGPLAPGDQLRLSMVLKQNMQVKDLKKILEFAQFSLMHKVFICHFQALPDTFLGGSMLEAVIRNTHSNDVDGKLVASVFDLHTRELLAENNNCAFAREGSESMVEINFPDAEKLMKGNIYLFSITLLDKENNEEIVDELILPIRF